MAKAAEAFRLICGLYKTQCRKEGNMRETLKRIKADMILSAVLCVILGIVILFWPEQTIGLFCRVLAAGLIVMGVLYVLSYFNNRLMHPFSGILGFVVLFVGIWIFLKPQSVASLIPIVIGVILVVHAIQDIRLAFEVRRNNYESWWGMLVIASVSMVFGILSIVKAFGIVTFAVRMIGIGLIYDGVSDLWIVTTAARAARAFLQDAQAVDVDYKEVDGEE